MNELKKREEPGAKTGPDLKENLTGYFKGVRAEWDKVTWPERRQVAVETLVVLGVVIFFTTVVYLLDITFNYLFKLIPGG